MKLVDILARELAEWPEGCKFVGQASDGTLHTNNLTDWSERASPRWTEEKYTMAEDWSDAWVSRSEWQAAVDALNAPAVWDGEGLPPVGVDCEYRVGGATWFECNIRYVTTPYHGCPVEVVMFPAHLKSEQTAVVGDGEGEVSFRPIRTADQVAAEEREKAIREICIDAGSPEMTPGQMKVAEKLYQAGYRKQVAK